LAWLWLGFGLASVSLYAFMMMTGQNCLFSLCNIWNQNGVAAYTGHALM